MNCIKQAIDTLLNKSLSFETSASPNNEKLLNLAKKTKNIEKTTTKSKFQAEKNDKEI